jgi:hypothetical protein
MDPVASLTELYSFMKPCTDRIAKEKENKTERKQINSCFPLH